LRSQTASLNPGPKEQVLAVLGPPGDRSFSGHAEAWQYCRTGMQSDTFTTVWFVDGKVYRVTNQDAALVEWGPCSTKYPTVDWGQVPADLKIRIEQRQTRQRELNSEPPFTFHISNQSQYQEAVMPQKGYGFIEPSDGGNYVFVHINAVERAGLSSLK
jgi:hypothetical protein